VVIEVVVVTRCAYEHPNNETMMERHSSQLNTTNIPTLSLWAVSKHEGS